MLAKPKDTQSRDIQPDDRKKVIEDISKTHPGYTGENLRSLGISAGGLPTGPSEMQRLDIDPTEGIMWVHGDDVTSGPILTDEDFTREELESLEPFFMPVFCTFESTMPEIDILRGLILAKSGETGLYRRIGSCTLDEYDLAPFLCSLGNQELEYISSKENTSGEDDALRPTLGHACPSRLRLDDFVPDDAPSKTLDFIPKDFAQYEISIV